MCCQQEGPLLSTLRRACDVPKTQVPEELPRAALFLMILGFSSGYFSRCSLEFFTLLCDPLGLIYEFTHSTVTRSYAV